MSSELDIFNLPSTQTSIESSSFLHYEPVSSFSDDGDAPIDFVIPSAIEHYIDLAHTMLYVKARIQPNEETPAENLKVAPVNNLLHSVFNQIDVFLNQKLVSPPNNAYPYTVYIESLLNYSPIAKESHLMAGLCYDDTAGLFEAQPQVHGELANKGALNQQHFTLNGKTFDMIGHRHCDVLN